MPTAEKVAAVEELTEILRQSKGVYLTDFTGLDVPAITQLRKRLREGEVSYRVVKNRLALLAVKAAGVSGLEEMLQGPTGLVYSDGDPVAPARLLAEFAGQAGGRPKLKAGLIEGQVYIEDRLEMLATLPPRPVLLGQMVTAIQSPLSGLAFCLNGILQSLVRTLHALAEKRREEGGDAPVVSEGGDAPVVSEGGDAPVVSEGGDAPVVSEGGDAPAVSEGGDAPAVPE